MINAIIYCENEFGKVDGKVANGLIRHSEKYRILGVIDSSKAGLDAGEHLSGSKNGIPIFQNLDEALGNLSNTQIHFIYGIAPNSTFLSLSQRNVILSAMERGLNIVNGLPELLTEDLEFSQKATEFEVKIYDIRKAPNRQNLHHFTGKINDVKTPVITILGTDCAVGKRTTSVKLVEALKEEGINAIFIATGQTGILQGAKYGVAIDVLSSGFATGEVEHAILRAHGERQPDVIIVEGQGALSHPAYTSSSAILKGSRPDAVIIQHAHKRKFHCDYPQFRLPSLLSEINLIETFMPTEVIAIALNHEGMKEDELENVIREYESNYTLPTTDVLKQGCSDLFKALFGKFPNLEQVALSYNNACQPQD